MKTKSIYFLILGSALLALQSTAQESKKDTVTKKIALGTPNIVIRDGHNFNPPLVFLNDKNLGGTPISQFYFNYGLLSISIIKGEGAIKLYGEAGKNGVLIYATKKPIEWLTSEEILQGIRETGKCKPEKLIARTNQTMMENDNILYDKNKVAYFDKDFIEKLDITLNSIGECTVILYLKK